VVSSLAIGAAMMVLGCASIIKGGSPQSVSIRSVPSDADVKILDNNTGNVLHAGRTPMIVALEKSRGFFSGSKYRVLVEKPGYEPREALIDSSVSGWYLAGNIIFGGLIGWFIVDPATGAMWTLGPEELSIELTPAKANAPATTEAPAAKPLSSNATPTTGGLAVVSLDDFALQHPDLLGRMKPVLLN
jgi:hypothetical protein